eukprot:201658-Amphidinium_carterae.1
MESEGVAFALDETHECIILSVPHCAWHVGLALDRELDQSPGQVVAHCPLPSSGGPPQTLIQSVPYGRACQVDRSAPHWPGKPPGDVKGETEAHSVDGREICPVRDRTGPLVLDEHILFRDGVPSCQTHESDPHISDRVVAMYGWSMCTIEDMGPMSVQHACAAHARLCDVAARDVSGDQSCP